MSQPRPWLAAVALLLAALPLPAAEAPARKFEAVVWGTDETTDLASFEKAAARAKAAGATHLVISDNLPRSRWEYALRPGDPYPAWYTYRPGLFKVFPPVALREFIPEAYAESASAVLVKRCAVLRKLGLKGVYQANEPQVLPEGVFKAHPTWRGPRVDQENRSTSAHFAPCVDEPEVLALYRESVAQLLEKCPEIEHFRFVTTDAGSGFCWSPGLYPGANGPTACKDRPMGERLRGLIEAMQAGAKDAKGAVTIRFQQIEPEEWMTPTFADPAGLAKQLPAGAVVNNFASPTGAPFVAFVGWGNPSWTFYNPVRGVPNPAAVLGWLRGAYAGPAGRLQMMAPRGWDDLYARMLERVAKAPPSTSAQEAAMLEAVAAEEVGAEHAETLVQVWQALAKAAEFGDQVKFAYPSTLGGVHQRWITRPFVPYPENLTQEEMAYYRPLLFQAKGEVQANDLVDLQAMRLYKGWSGRMWILNVYARVDSVLKDARKKLGGLIPKLQGEKRWQYELLDRKLAVFQLLCTNARNAVNYQAVLDYLKEQRVGTDENPPLGAMASWDRKMILEVAREELDNTVALLEMVKKYPDLIDHAATKEEEEITLLGPDLADQLQRKIDLMNAHWQDYNRLTTVPNP